MSVRPTSRTTAPAETSCECAPQSADVQAALAMAATMIEVMSAEMERKPDDAITVYAVRSGDIEDLLGALEKEKLSALQRAQVKIVRKNFEATLPSADSFRQGGVSQGSSSGIVLSRH
jgi:hypothetical protein